MQPPTLQEIERGLVGNGTWDPSAEALERHRNAHIEKQRKAKEKREAHFEEQAKDGLSDAMRLRRRLVERAHKLLDRKEAGEVLTKDEIAEVKAGERAAEWIADRGLGKSVARVEATTTNNWISFIKGDLNVG